MKENKRGFYTRLYLVLENNARIFFIGFDKGTVVKGGATKRGISILAI